MWLLIIAIVIVGIVYGIHFNKNAQMLGENGRIIQRENQFWENGEYFYTSAAYEDVLEEIGKADFSDCRVTITPNYKGDKIIAFVARNRFTAALVYDGEKNGENTFDFAFLSWKNDRIVTSSVQMNLLLTIIEKIFLSLDPNTDAEIHLGEVKTKTSFL